MDRVAAHTADRKAVAIAEEAVVARPKVVVTAVAEATARHRAEAVRAVDLAVDLAAEALRHQAAAIPQDITAVDLGIDRQSSWRRWEAGILSPFTVRRLRKEPPALRKRR